MHYADLKSKLMNEDDLLIIIVGCSFFNMEQPFFSLSQKWKGVSYYAYSM